MSSGHGSRRKTHAEHEEHENHERWLVSYADMVTLLMVLFVVMFAMSQVDEKKYAQLKEGLAAGFGSSDSLLDGNDSILDPPGSAPGGFFCAPAPFASAVAWKKLLGSFP